MSKPHSKSHHLTAFIKRPGDHYFVDVTVESRLSTSGETINLLGIALGAAPVPERRYVADVCSVKYDNLGIKLIFGQSKLVQDQLRSAVVVKMSRRAVANLLSVIEAVTNPSYAEIAEKLKLKSAEPLKLTTEPEQVVTLTANLAISAMSGEEGSIDFFQLSPFAMAAMSKGARQAPIDPVVRVDLHSEMLLGLIESLRHIPGMNKDLMEAGT